jgi:hypothetical protein
MPIRIIAGRLKQILQGAKTVKAAHAQASRQVGRAGTYEERFDAIEAILVERARREPEFLTALV